MSDAEKAEKARENTSIPIRVGVIVPSVSIGGGEQWLLSLVKHTSGGKVSQDGESGSVSQGSDDNDPPGRPIEWVGCAVAGMMSRSIDPRAIRELASLMPVHLSRGQFCYGNAPIPTEWSKFPGVKYPVFWHVERKTGIHVLSTLADILIVWGVPNLAAYLPDDNPGIQFAIGAPAWILRSKPLVIVSHGCDNEFTGDFISRVSHLATHAVAVSRMAAWPLRGSGLPADRIKVIYNGVDPDHCLSKISKQEARAKYGWSEDDLIVGYVGRMSREKEPLALAEAVAELRRRDKSSTGIDPARWKAWYVGPPSTESGNHGPTIEQQIAEMLGSAVRFSPPERPIADVLRCLDCHLSASPAEGFGLSTVECWLAGVPTVTTPVGVVAEHLNYLGITTCVPFGAPADWLADAVQLAHRGSRKSRAIEYAQVVASGLYSADRMGREWMRFLRSIA